MWDSLFLQSTTGKSIQDSEDRLDMKSSEARLLKEDQKADSCMFSTVCAHVSTAANLNPFQMNNIGTICHVQGTILNILPYADTWEAGTQRD